MILPPENQKPQWHSSVNVRLSSDLNGGGETVWKAGGCWFRTRLLVAQSGGLREKDPHPDCSSWAGCRPAWLTSPSVGGMWMCTNEQIWGNNCKTLWVASGLRQCCTIQSIYHLQACIMIGSLDMVEMLTDAGSTGAKRVGLTLMSSRHHGALLLLNARS